MLRIQNQKLIGIKIRLIKISRELSPASLRCGPWAE